MPDPIKKRTVRIYEPLLVALAAAIGMIAGYKMDFNNNDYSLIKIDSAEQNLIKRDGRIEEILRFVETNYVDSLDQDEIAIDAIQHILRQLDPHSSYITAEELEDHNEKMEGKYKGVGIETLEFKDTFYISRVINGSPADEAGVEAGDAIIKMNGEDITGENGSFAKVRSFFKESSESKLSIELLPLDGQEMKQLIVEAEEIEVPSANLSFHADDHVAYIRMTRFSANTYEQFMRSLETLVDDRQSLDLIIDLRDNPGGYLPEAVNILSQLFNEKGKLLCYTEGLNRKRSEYHSTGKTFYNIGKIVVLINEYSASGSEILAGAIQDWDRGYVIGKQSYGKGLVQEIFPLKNGGALRLTVAKYYTPSGRLIQKAYNNINNSFEADTNHFKTMLLEREVAGGGGISPDMEVEDNFDHHCYALTDYVDYYLLYKMKQTASNELSRSDFSEKELLEFAQAYFEEDISSIAKLCQSDIEAYIYSRYVRWVDGLLEYHRELIKDDVYVQKALEFIQNNKTTLALLTMEE